MSNRTTLTWAITLIVLGFAGLATWALTLSLAGDATFSSNGQSIYYTGRSADGSPIPRTVAGAGMMGRGMMGAVACVDCHGEDGRGGRLGMMFGVVEIPDIRYSAITSARLENGVTASGWTDGDLARAIRDGFEPDGQRLKAPMPRFDMTDAEIGEVISYLKELDAR